FAREGIRKEGYAILVEGYMDVIALHQAGVVHAVATLGTGFTTGHVRLLKRFTDRVVVNFDPDAAGRAATRRSLEVLLESGFEVSVVSLPAKKDPDLFVREQGPEKYRQRRGEAGPVGNPGQGGGFERGAAVSGAPRQPGPPGLARGDDRLGPRDRRPAGAAGAERGGPRAAQEPVGGAASGGARLVDRERVGVAPPAGPDGRPRGARRAPRGDRGRRPGNQPDRGSGEGYT